MNKIPDKAKTEALKQLIFEDLEYILIAEHDAYMERKRLLAQGKLKTTGILDLIRLKDDRI